MNRPNLFDFATSELSQDAFISWLLSWADPGCRDDDPSLHVAGNDLLRTLFSLAEHPLPEKIEKVKVWPQFEYIDILVVVNDKFPLLIEDKTLTKDHSDQLARYKDVVKKKYPVESFPAIYFKTGDQSNYDSIEKHGYHVFSRKQFLATLQRGLESGVANSIFLDFYRYLDSIEASVNSYRLLRLEEWRWEGQPPWRGFYMELQRELNDGNWDYVANPSGGFMGFWWHWKENKYLQLQHDKLCFKIKVLDEERQKEERNAWHKRLLAAKPEDGLAVTRPSRMGRGKWMTVAMLDGDYRQKTPAGSLDLPATVAKLRAAERFMDRVLAES